MVRRTPSRTRRPLLLVTVPLFLATRVLLAAIPFRFVRRLAGRMPAVRRGAVDVADVAWAVATAARLTHAHDSCLSEAITAHALLRASGVASDLRFDVNRTGAGVSAHASVVVESGAVVGAPADRTLVTLLPARRAARHA